MLEKEYKIQVGVYKVKTFRTTHLFKVTTMFIFHEIISAIAEILIGI